MEKEVIEKMDLILEKLSAIETRLDQIESIQTVFDVSHIETVHVHSDSVSGIPEKTGDED